MILYTLDLLYCLCLVSVRSQVFTDNFPFTHYPLFRLNDSGTREDSVCIMCNEEFAKPEFRSLKPKGFHLKVNEVPSETIWVELYCLLITKFGKTRLSVENQQHFVTRMVKTDVDCYETVNNKFVFKSGDYFLAVLWYDIESSSKPKRVYRNTYRILIHDQGNSTIIFHGK